VVERERISCASGLARFSVEETDVLPTSGNNAATATARGTRKARRSIAAPFRNEPTLRIGCYRPRDHRAPHLSVSTACHRYWETGRIIPVGLLCGQTRPLASRRHEQFLIHRPLARGRVAPHATTSHLHQSHPQEVPTPEAPQAAGAASGRPLSVTATPHRYRVSLDPSAPRLHAHALYAWAEVKRRPYEDRWRKGERRAVPRWIDRDWLQGQGAARWQVRRCGRCPAASWPSFVSAYVSDRRRRALA
jgi:hypothetical protein